MTAKKANPYAEMCPSRDVLALIGSKWSMLLICLLREGPVRTGVLRRSVEGISQKMLTQTLRELERHGLIERIDYAEVPPRVEYQLTALGHSLSALVEQIEQWVRRHYPRIRTAAQTFDAEQRVS